MLTKEELALACGLTLKEANELLKTYDDVISFQARQEAIHEMLKQKYIDIVIKSENYHGLDTLCMMLPEILKHDLYTLRLAWLDKNLAKQPYQKMTLTKEESERVYKNAGQLKQMYPGEPKKEAIAWLVNRLSTLHASVDSFIELLHLCEEYKTLEAKQETMGEDLWEKQIKKVRDYLEVEKMKVLVDHLPPLYCRFQATEILVYMEANPIKIVSV